MHWQLLFGSDSPALSPEARTMLTEIHDNLDLYFRILLALGFVFAGLSLFGSPKWPAMIALGVSALLFPLVVGIT